LLRRLILFALIPSGNPPALPEHHYFVDDEDVKNKLLQMVVDAMPQGN
jgi:hypothetical protein